MRALLRPILAAPLLMLAGCGTPVAAPADLIIVNARVFGNDSAEAVAVRGNRIAAVGSGAAIEALRGSATKRIDAKGGSVTPGLNDAHVHFIAGSLSLGLVNLLDAETLPEVEEQIRAFAAANPTTPWVQGLGWVYGAFPGDLPTKEQLDRLVPDRPALMGCYDGHTSWVNSKALALAGITKNTPDPPNGQIVRDPQTGEPTGVLKEGAQALVEKVLPAPSREAKLAAIRAGIAQALRLGVTSVQEAGIGEEELDLLETLRASGDLKLRIYLALKAHPNMTDTEIAALDSLKARFPGLRIGAVKFYADGVIESHTAALLAPYSNAPTRGRPEYTAADLNRVVAGVDRRGWQIMIHAIGDAGIRMALDALEAAARQNPAPGRGRRHRLEHIEDVSSEDIPRFGRLGIIASMQPFHASPNGNVLDVWAKNIGPERAARAWSWKAIADAGGRLAFGTDWPVVGIDPRPGIHTALTRQTAEGRPEGGFGADQRLDLATVLRGYTEGSALAEFEEGNKGRIASGLLADLVVWDRDLFAVRPSEVKDASVVATIADGKVVFP